MVKKSKPLILDIVEQVAAAESADPSRLDPPLGTYIDTDALISLFDRANGPLRVTFHYLDYEVTVISEGDERDVFVRKPS